MADSEFRVLIVDRDRFSALISKMLAGKFSTDLAADGLQAIRKLRASPPHAIVVEHNIPGNGIRLAELVGMNPRLNSVPIILTSATPSPDMILRARNAGISTYLAKPFRPSELINRLNAALQSAASPPAEAKPGPAPKPAAEKKASAPAQPDEPDEPDEPDDDKVRTIKDRVKQIEGLPPFPATHTEILTLAQSEESSSDDIAERLQMDTSMLASVFKLVNSTYYGFRKKVDSLKLAVTLLGLEEIANLVMAAQVFQKLGKYEGGGLDLDAFWKHSVGTAFIARAIAKKLQTQVESAFLAGMLHDLGKIVLDCYFGDYYKAVLEIVKAEQKSIVDAEHEILGITHADVGAQLAVEWKFSDNYLNTILYHHAPSGRFRYQRLVCLVHVADAICRDVGYGSGGDEAPPKVDKTALDRFNLGDKGMQILKEAAEQELQDADSFLSALTS